ncbi:MAG: hypothetical protein ACTSQI_21270 [Candidatus Helarchaeota archaeon]
MDEETRDIWKKLAAKTKSESEDSGELPTAEDLVQGPLPEAPDEIAERQRKLEAARLAEEAKRQEEARRAEELRKAEEEAIRLAEEDARKAEEERIAEELHLTNRKRNDRKKLLQNHQRKRSSHHPKLPLNPNPVQFQRATISCCLGW